MLTQRLLVLYLTMRFAKTIKQIQGLQAYHSGDKLNVEVSHDEKKKKEHATTCVLEIIMPLG